MDRWPGLRNHATKTAFPGSGFWNLTLRPINTAGASVSDSGQIVAHWSVIYK